MNESQRKMIADLEAMPLDEARRLIAEHHYGQPGSINQSLCESWLTAKEADLRDANNLESLSISREALKISKRANKIAIFAIIFSILTATIIAYVSN